MPQISFHMLWHYVRKNVGSDNCMAITSEKRFGLVDYNIWYWMKSAVIGMNFGSILLCC
jgi:hypothetical protein